MSRSNILVWGAGLYHPDVGSFPHVPTYCNTCNQRVLSLHVFGEKGAFDNLSQFSYTIHGQPWDARRI